MKLAVIGGGWAGLAAAVHAVQAGHQVSVFEMSPQWGGRARSVGGDGALLDNGQHILIGAYAETLALMHTVGVDVGRALHREPLELRYPDGRGLRMPAGPAWLVFGWAVACADGWSWRDKLALVTAAASWAARGFRCADALTVDQLCRALPRRVREVLIDPLCIAALNTPATQASAAVFLRVLRDALFAGRGSSDLLLPRQGLSDLLPEPAAAWLARHGAVLQLGCRVQALKRAAEGWQVEGQRFDAVVLACSTAEAGRLAQPLAPAWAAQAEAFDYEPIVTVYADSANTTLAQPMTALAERVDAPAQFVFDHGQLGGAAGRFAFVVSGARPWVERGLQATAEAVLAQALRDFPAGTWKSPPRLLRVLAEKRATFSCVPALNRPPSHVAAGLAAAGDYVAGPYPATLEGAVRSGRAAVQQLSSC